MTLYTQPKKVHELLDYVYVNLGAFTVKKGRVHSIRTTVSEGIYRIEYQISWLVTHERTHALEWFDEIDVKTTANEAFYPLEEVAEVPADIPHIQV